MTSSSDQSLPNQFNFGPLKGRNIIANFEGGKRIFGLCYAMDGGYKGCNPYIERHLAIFVNCF